MYAVTHRLGIVLALAAAAVWPAGAVTNGVMVLQNLTIPRGGAWIPGALGGHFWVTDTAAGICRVDPAGGSPTGFQTTNCNGTVKSGGQPSVGVAPNGTTYIFVPDNSTTSTAVVRFQFNPANETLSSPLIMDVPNVTSVGGGARGGRAVATALDSLGNLYVGYIKSGDIMKVPGAMITTSQTPPTSRVASTSDGRGVTALLLFGNDMYVAETGGFGLSMIPDPSGFTRPACNSTAPCTASSLSPQLSFFPGGLASDGVSIYIGDQPLTTPGRVLQWNPAAPLSATNPAVYSQNVPPYVSAFDGKTRSQYVGIAGLVVAPNGDLYVADDPTTNMIVVAPAVLPTAQGHLWKVAFPGAPLTITSFAPASGPDTGGTTVTINGTGFTLGGAVTSFKFGAVAGTNVNCTTVTLCTVRTPSVPGGGLVPITANSAGQTFTTATSFSFTVGTVGNPPTITSISPSIGLPAGGTSVVVTGTNLFIAGKVTSVIFGLAGPGTVVAGSCTTVSCTVISPAFPSGGTVDIQMNVDGRLSATSAADRFTYRNATANLFAWGITAPKGGMTFIPGNLPPTVGDPVTGGHMWSSDHAQGFCRHDLLTQRVASLGTPASAGSRTLHAMNSAICDNGTIGSPGQPVYDPRVNGAFINATTGASIPAGTHFIYVPDNAVKSTAVWRLTFDPNTETLVDAPEAMVPLADVRTLKPNGMALGPDGNLYITDLTEANIRRLTGPQGDPRLQTISVVAVTGDGRGANGTIGFIGNFLYVSENRAAAFFDVTTCPTLAGPCQTTPIPLPAGVFVAGVATDPVRGYVYAADSPGGANATIWRYNVNTGAPPIPYLTAGQLPAAGTPEATVWISQTGVRPWNPAYIPGGTAGFSFAFGISVDVRNGDLYITGDPLAGARGGFGTAWVAKLVQ